MKKFILLIGTVFFSLAISQAQQPDRPEMIKVTVDKETQDVCIHWKASKDTLVDFYKIYYWRGAGISGADGTGIIIDSIQTIVGQDEYVFCYRDKNVLKNPVGFYVNARKPNSTGELEYSPNSRMDSTMFIESEFDSCEAKIDFSWNPYTSWGSTLVGYELYVSTDSVNFDLAAQYNSGTTDTAYRNISQIGNYYFYVAAINEYGDTSLSNISKVKVDMSIPPAYINANYATIDNGVVELEFLIDSISELTNYDLFRSSNETAGYELIESFSTKSDTISYTDQYASLTHPNYYKLGAINNCGNQVTASNLASSISLSLTDRGDYVELAWNHYKEWRGGMEPYVVYRNFNTEDYSRLTTVSDNYHVDDISMFVDQGKGNKICYKIEAKEGGSNPYGIRGRSESNEVCLFLDPNFTFEFDAIIVGEGKITPKFDFLPPYYRFTIYSRWGERVYESLNPEDEGWDGYYKGKKVPTGVYRYQLEYKLDSETMKILHGNVTVIDAD